MLNHNLADELAFQTPAALAGYVLSITITVREWKPEYRRGQTFANALWMSKWRLGEV